MGKYAFRYLWVGQSLANLGDVLYVVSIISLVHHLIGSSLAIGMVPFLFVSAQFISGFTAPLLFDRYKLQSILFFSQLVKTLLLFSVIGFTAAFLTKDNVWLLFVLVFFLAFLDGWASPSRNALIPSLIEPDQLVKANSLLSTADQLVQLLGWAFGGVLVASFSSQFVLWLTVAFYVLSTLSMGMIRTEGREETRDIEEAVDQKSGWRLAQEGWIAIWGQPTLRSLVVMDILEGMAGAVWIAAILLVFVQEVLGHGEEWWGFINASYTIGTFAGGLLVLALAKRIEGNERKFLIVSTIFSSIITASFGLIPIPMAALLLSALLGPFHQMQMIAKQTAFQKEVTPHLLAKAFSVKGSLDALLFGLSVLGMSWIADVWGVQTVYVLAAVLTGCSALVACLVPWKRRKI